MADVPEISGFCDERFLGVRDALIANFRERGELGAAVAIAVEGRPVVDIWAGWMDAECTRPWQRDTLVDVFSVGKAMAALCVLILVERGDVDLDRPVSRYWPEFAAGGKREVTVRMLLAHRAGLPAVRRSLPDLAMYDWELMAAALAEETPWWEPGSRHGYHVNTFGFLTGEIVRRVSGEDIGAFLRREVTSRLAADFHFGLGPEQDCRTAEYVWASSEVAGDERGELSASDRERHFLLDRAYMNPPGMSGLGTVNTRDWRAAQIPSANGHATARAVALIYGALTCDGAIGGVRLLQRDDRARDRGSVIGDRFRAGTPLAFRARLSTDSAGARTGAEPAKLRPLRRRWLAGIRRSRCATGVRLHDEPFRASLAESSQQSADRRGLRFTLRGQRQIR
jgi:CubicO group peptidase (beta-lactamase class C family)